MKYTRELYKHHFNKEKVLRGIISLYHTGDVNFYCKRKKYFASDEASLGYNFTKQMHVL